MQRFGLGPLGAMRDQSLFRTCISSTVGTPLQALSQRLLSVICFPKEILRRTLALAILATVMVSTSAPARGQTYGSGYPVCLHVYRPATYYACSYASSPRCNA